MPVVSTFLQSLRILIAVLRGQMAPCTSIDVLRIYFRQSFPHSIDRVRQLLCSNLREYPLISLANHELRLVCFMGRTDVDWNFLVIDIMKLSPGKTLSVRALSHITNARSTRLFHE